MTRKLYVGNLPFSASEEQLKALFSAQGEVRSVALITDRETGRPRGFGFVEMSDDDALRAVTALDGQDFGGRRLRVNEARQRAPRRRGWGELPEGSGSERGARAGRGPGGWSSLGGRDGW